MDRPTLRRRLLAWYRRARRDLPWRGAEDPYRIWISEVMLQQTRVTAVIPYYQRFVARFPDAAALAAASDDDLLTAWSGLGYYSRARNLREAARAIVARGRFPSDYDSIRALPGVGDYTAAAVSSIAFGLPHPAVDGNVRRVLARLTAQPGDRDSIAELAAGLLDRAHPGDFNQALMELGATVCLPRRPQCSVCPLGPSCQARASGEQERYPARTVRPAIVRTECDLLLIRGRRGLLLSKRGDETKRLAGFWELPEASAVAGASFKQRIGRIRHSILNQEFSVALWEATIRRKPSKLRWVEGTEVALLPLTTATRKALRLAGFQV